MHGGGEGMDGLHQDPGIMPAGSCTLKYLCTYAIQIESSSISRRNGGSE